MHCEDSQLLKHHGCTAAEDTAGKVPQHWIPPLPQKPQTLHIMPATERKRRRERKEGDGISRGKGGMRKTRERGVKVGESKDRKEVWKRGKARCALAGCQNKQGSDIINLRPSRSTIWRLRLRLAGLSTADWAPAWSESGRPGGTQHTEGGFSCV